MKLELLIDMKKIWSELNKYIQPTYKCLLDSHWKPLIP